MTRHHVGAHPLETWLAAENRADPAASEAALGDLLRRLPAIAPPADLVARVMDAAAGEGLVSARSVREGRRRPVRTFAWAGGAAGLVLAIIVIGGPMLVRLVVRLLNLSVQGFVWIVSGLEGGLDTWSLIIEMGRALSATLMTPQVGAGLLLMELAGVAALYMLRRMLASDRHSAQ